MSVCSELRPMLARVAEGDAGPDEAMAVARHLPDCTACRILLAKEVRLEAALSSLEDPVTVDEGFLTSVMRALPKRPSKARRRRTRLTLVGGGSAFLWALLVAVAATAAPGLRDPLTLGLPSLDASSVGRAIELAGVAVVWLRVALEGLSGFSGFSLPSFRSLAPVVTMAASGLAAMGVAVTAVLFACGSTWMRLSRPRG